MKLEAPPAEDGSRTQRPLAAPTTQNLGVCFLVGHICGKFGAWRFNWKQCIIGYSRHRFLSSDFVKLAKRVAALDLSIAALGSPCRL